jgi:putative tryptophan/tyrosine transport system substrate-binding protein
VKRREFIAGLGGVVAIPHVAGGQERLRRIAMLMPGEEEDPAAQALMSDFLKGLGDLGWSNGRNVRLDLRWAGRNVDKMRRHAKELVELNPDVIVVSSGPVTRAVRERTRTIPIIFMAVGDPVAGGLVQSISRPEGNTTGVTNLFVSLAEKWLELLKEAAPRMKRVAVLVEVDSAGPLQANYINLIEAGAARTAVTVSRLPVRSTAEIERAIQAFAAEPDGGLIVLPPGHVLSDRLAINRLALHYRLPTMYPYRYNAAEGGLMAYGSDLAEQFRQSGPSYVDRVLRGAPVSELPVQFPTRLSFVINLKTASVLGLELPQSILLRADEVIE